MSRDTIQARVNTYLEKHGRWQSQLSELRRILLSAGLSEDIKWGAPAYKQSEGP